MGKKKAETTYDYQPLSKRIAQRKEKVSSSEKPKNCITPKKTSKKTKETSKTNGPVKRNYPKLIEETDNEETEQIKLTAKPPTRNKKGELVFDTYPEFQPNMTPKEVLQAGSFGGTYFRPIKSVITGKSYSGIWKELPKDWLEGLNIDRQIASSVYHEDVNTYKVKSGGSLQMWEESGWINKQDPYGWFQWYCRFYQGRRTVDDQRQIGRWLRCAGRTGRWRNNLIAKCFQSGCDFDNSGISPVVRQTLQHWGYRLTKEDFEAGAEGLRKKGSA
ncbi:hypothetical protein CHS0354_021674 [Potamilus streckersoni]|uniref:Uncharacterized protein n=1 Tax=Potamilus streckersoni TaxID=2493646 RepID=A0AAE0SI29_9BIVA|nr:hypothetical protein CHS0354_021674 [Potamilus streckersoni]